jgi:hypothetical protein
VRKKGGRDKEGKRARGEESESGKGRDREEEGGWRRLLDQIQAADIF